MSGSNKKPLIFRKNDLFLIIGIVALAVVMLVVFVRSAAGSGEAVLEITCGSSVYGIYPLNEDREISIEDKNTVIIKDGQVYMAEADCPDKLCVNSKPISSRGQSIVCLPNRIVLKIKGVQENDDLPDVIGG